MWKAVRWSVPPIMLKIMSMREMEKNGKRQEQPEGLD
jgi:hypothetical protein